jgi:xanthine/uracil/vitamin C permease (AzgA family)
MESSGALTRFRISVETYFQIQARKSTIGKEFIGGTTSFLTVCYILIVNPKMLAVAGIPIKDGGNDILAITCCGL